MDFWSGLGGVIIGGFITALTNWFFEDKRYKKEVKVIYRQKREEVYLKYSKLMNKFYHIYDSTNQFTELEFYDFQHDCEKCLEITTRFENEYNSILNELQLFCNEKIINKTKEILYNYINDKYSIKEFNNLIELLKEDLGIDININK